MLRSTGLWACCLKNKDSFKPLPCGLSKLLDWMEPDHFIGGLFELADSYNWQGLEQSKAVEYKKLALDLAEKEVLVY